jgi:hypothetical protein
MADSKAHNGDFTNQIEGKSEKLSGKPGAFVTGSLTNNLFWARPSPISHAGCAGR